MKTCIEDKCKRKVSVSELYLNDNAFKSVSTQKHIIKIEDRQALEATRYGDTISEELHIAVKHFFQLPKLIQAHKRLLDVITCTKA